MSQPLEVEYVELRAKGTEKTAAEIESVLDQIKESIEQAADKIEKDITEASATLATEVTAAADEAKHAIDDFADDAISDLERLDRQIAETEAQILLLGRTFARTGNMNVLNELGSERGLLGDLKRVRKEIAAVDDEIGGGGGFISTLQSVIGPLGQFGALLGGSPLLSTLIALSPAIFGLAGSLLDLVGVIGVLPAGISVLISAIAPLILSFKGMGDAISALASGDIDKINEAMKNLAPSARIVAREIAGLAKPLKDLQMQVQQAFFVPLEGVIGNLVRSLLPTLRGGLTAVASQLGTLFAGLARVIATPANLKVISDVFGTTARIIKDLGPAFDHFVDALFRVTQAGLPFVERMAGAFGGLLDRFAGFIDESVKSGKFNEFVENAFNALKALGDLSGAVFDLIVALFGNAGDEGNDFLKALAGIVEEFAKFAASKEGQEAIQKFLDAIPLIVAGLGTALKIFEFVIITQNELFNLLGEIGGAAKEAWGAVVGFFKGAGDAAGSFWNSVVGIFDSVVGFFEGLPGKIGGALAQLPGLAVQFFDMFWQAIGFGIGTVIKLLLDLPTNVLHIIQDMWNTAVENTKFGLNFIASLVNQLPTLLVTTFTNAWNSAKSIFSEGVNAVVNFASTLPGRIGAFLDSMVSRVRGTASGASSWLFNAGKDVVNGLIHGVESVIGHAIDVVKRAMSDIVAGAKRALGINSPSKVFADEVGKSIPEGIALGVTRNLNMTHRAIDNATDPTGMIGSARSGPLLGSGAIQVVFQGVIPTETEAMRTGQAVGIGAARALVSQGVRAI